MSVPIAVLGDDTDHGGRIISGSDTHKIGGKPIARLYDLVDCPARYPDGRSHGINVDKWIKRCYWGVLDEKERYQSAEVEMKDLTTAIGG